MKPGRALFCLPAALGPARAYTELSDAALAALARPSDTDFDIYTGALLAPILQPRVPGTPGSEAVLAHFVDFFATNLPAWQVTLQNSSSVTPTSGGQEVPFRNLIATRDPPWLASSTGGGAGEVGRLALAAHYDSKLTPAGFIGATDSAAPCAMLLHAARAIDDALTRKWAAMEAEGAGTAGWVDVEEQRGVQILLLDGEEAFKTWTHTDSLYGARSLAEEWEATLHPALSTYRTPLASIELFVLLDLLGGASPTVPSYFKTTHWAYRHMASAEQRMRARQLFQAPSSHPFLTEASKTDEERWTGGFVEDDHLPFMARGVEVLHIIPSPFPAVWHKLDDDGEHLDMATVADWAMITTAFAAEWLELGNYIEAEGAAEKERKVDEGKDELPGAR